MFKIKPKHFSCLPKHKSIWWHWKWILFQGGCFGKRWPIWEAISRAFH